jgi:hypothetical protein
MNNQGYQVAHGTYYHKEPPAAVIGVLEQVRKGGVRIRLSYGDTETGRDWLDEFSVEGTISRSIGPVKVPILLARRTSFGGPALLDHCIVNIRRTGKGGRVLYKHPKYHMPTFAVQPSTLPGFEAEVLADGKVHARFGTIAQAMRWIGKMTG